MIHLKDNLKIQLHSKPFCKGELFLDATLKGKKVCSKKYLDV